MLYMYIIMVKFSLYIMYVQVVFINLFFVYVNKPEDDNHVENIQDSEGANIDRRLVPYTRDAMRTKSHIEFIYIFIYMHQPCSSCARHWNFGPGK